MDDILIGAVLVLATAAALLFFAGLAMLLGRVLLNLARPGSPQPPSFGPDEP
ncbi:MAG: hypothetical protein KatS3mg127_1248 [Silanimonas sp.]|jgi:hypothetical protein|nr:MAG: hypothetical protein KatS3mg127_1248 [Silanimonas sp.]